MSFFELQNKKLLSHVSSNPATVKAIEKCKNVGVAVDKRIMALGMQYYEDNKDDESSKYYKDIQEIEKLRDQEHLCYQYCLSLEDKRLCEECKAIITADSLFCNKCGSKLKELDYSYLEMINTESETGSVNTTKICLKCGGKIEEGALFCETCGTKVQ